MKIETAAQWEWAAASVQTNLSVACRIEVNIPLPQSQVSYTCDILSAARQCFELGIAVTVCGVYPYSKDEAYSFGKVPYKPLKTDNGKHIPTTIEEIERYVTGRVKHRKYKPPPARWNLAIIHGVGRNQLTCVDIDSTDTEHYRIAVDVFGIPEYVECTRHGGWHLWYRSRYRKLGVVDLRQYGFPGEIRDNDCTTLIAPSEFYTVNRGSLADVSTRYNSDWQERLTAEIRPAEVKKAKAQYHETIMRGERNNRLAQRFRVEGKKIYERGGSFDEYRLACLHIDATECEEPCQHDELAKLEYTIKYQWKKYITTGKVICGKYVKAIAEVTQNRHRKMFPKYADADLAYAERTIALMDTDEEFCLCGRAMHDNGLMKDYGWNRFQQYYEANKRLQDSGVIDKVYQGKWHGLDSDDNRRKRDANRFLRADKRVVIILTRKQPNKGTLLSISPKEPVRLGPSIEEMRASFWNSEQKRSEIMNDATGPPSSNGGNNENWGPNVQEYQDAWASLFN